MDNLHNRPKVELRKKNEIFYHFWAEIAAKMVTFPPRNTNISQNSQTLQGYIFRILQHFATKLCNSTNLRILFLAVAKDFVFLA